MFFGQWNDDLGIVHRKGMADLLLTPRIAVWPALQEGNPKWLMPVETAPFDIRLRVTVPLWVECKSGSGELDPEQIAFRDHVVKSGAYYLEAHDCADVVLEWFEFYWVLR
jgi:hypothetical protein